MLELIAGAASSAIDWITTAVTLVVDAPVLLARFRGVAKSRRPQQAVSSKAPFLVGGLIAVAFLSCVLSGALTTTRRESANPPVSDSPDRAMALMSALPTAALTLAMNGDRETLPRVITRRRGAEFNFDIYGEIRSQHPDNGTWVDPTTLPGDIKLLKGRNFAIEVAPSEEPKKLLGLANDLREFPWITRVLLIDHAILKADILDSLSNDSRLTDVSLDRSDADDAGVKHLARLSKLSYLGLTGNRHVTTASVREVLKNCKMLRFIGLGDTAVTAEEAKQLQAEFPHVLLGHDAISRKGDK